MKRTRTIVLVAPLLWASLCQAIDATVSFEVPGEPVGPNEMFEIPVFIDVPDHSLAGYAMTLEFDAGAAEVIDILGGTARGFEFNPVSYPEDFSSGSTRFAAISATLEPTPRRFQVARIQIRTRQVVAARLQLSLIQTDDANFASSTDFSGLIVEFPASQTVTVIDPGELIFNGAFE